MGWGLGLAILVLLLLGRRPAAGATSTPSTTSSYDPKVVQLAQAIARAEGFYAAGSLPQRNHNPGAITDSTGTVRAYASEDDGWAAAYRQVNGMLTGSSRIYSPDMSFAEVAATYVGSNPRDNPDAWASLVAGQLGMSVDDTLQGFLEGG